MTRDAIRTNATERRLIGSLIEAYLNIKPQLELFRDQLMPALSNSAQLAPHIHSIKSRLKDPDHLRGKLLRKLEEERKEHKPFKVTPDNLARTITDLLGIRILHLYTRQIRPIDEALREVFAESKFSLIEGPLARTWDNESRDFFRECSIKTRESPSMYTSVHYVIGSASRTKMTAEIQVRTLSEEVWGEVDHSMNYPEKSRSLPCREQLKVLARVTSSATRLVDSIFLTLEDHDRRSGASASPNRRVAATSGQRQRVK
jgi:ppGpp synthetase/RelA/SpoT-type nucleotidyltranferase